MESRIVPADQLPAEIYHAMPYLSFSQLKILCSDHAPIDFWYRSWLNPKRPGDDEETTKAKRFGSAMHMLLLEPDKFRTSYRQEAKHKSSSVPFVVGAAPNGDWDIMQRIRDNILEVPIASQILKGCRPEVSMICDMELEDIQAPRDRLQKFGVRCRHDIWKETYSADLKFVEDVTDSGIEAIVRRFFYHQQAEWYLRIQKRVTGNPHQNFAFIFCEKKPPFKVRVVQVREGPLADARYYNDEAFAKFFDYMKRFATFKGPWPAYGNVIYNLVMEGESGPHSIEMRPRYR